MGLSTKVALGAIAVGLAFKFVVGASNEEKLPQPTNEQVMEGTAAMIRAQGKIHPEVGATTSAVSPDPKGVNPLPISVARNRVTSKHLAIVCPSIFDLERGLNLHNAKRVDQALALGCRYLRPGEQGVRIQTVGNTQEIMFDTREGSVSYWGYKAHFVWEP